MAAQFDILIKNASLRKGYESSVDIGISNGAIQAIQKDLAEAKQHVTGLVMEV